MSPTNPGCLSVFVSLLGCLCKHLQTFAFKNVDSEQFKQTFIDFFKADKAAGVCVCGFLEGGSEGLLLSGLWLVLWCGTAHSLVGGSNCVSTVNICLCLTEQPPFPTNSSLLT